MQRATLSIVRRLATEAAAPKTSGKVKLNFAAPHEVFFKNTEVDLVNVPSTAGDMGILADHVPIIAQLRPGVVEVVQDSKSKKIFVSSGFLTMNPDSSLSINAIEAVTLDQLDVDLAKKNLAEAQKLVEKSANDVEKATAEAAAEVYQAIISSVH